MTPVGGGAGPSHLQVNRRSAAVVTSGELPALEAVARPVRLSSREMARALGALYMVGAVLALVWLVLPHGRPAR